MKSRVRKPAPSPKRDRICQTILDIPTGNDQFSIGSHTVAVAPRPGLEFISIKLEDENGCLVYSVKIKAADGKVYDVKVDAGTGKVVRQELEGAEEEKEGDED